MKRIYLFLFIIIFTCTTSVAQVTVTGSTGANGTYATLTDASAITGAFAAINAAGTQAGNNILITISADIIETAFTSLLGSDWASLTINPTGGAARLLSTNFNGAFINLTGVQNVTIDGLNIGGNSLTISNTSGSGSAITVRFANDATNNTVTRCTLLGSSGSLLGSGLATVYFGSGITTGNSNNTVSECNIGPAATGTPRNGIQSSSIAAAVNINNTISGNNIYDYFHPNVVSCGISLVNFNSGFTITGNKFYQTGTRTATTSNTHHGINITSGSGYTISNNIIGFANAMGTGTTNMIGLTTGSLGGTFPSSFTAGGTPNVLNYCGITCAFTAGGAVSSIQNNTIAGIALYTGSFASSSNGILCGINITSGNANVGTVTGNIIGSATGANSIYAASTIAGAVVAGIYCSSSNTINIQNNTIGGIDVSGTTATGATGFKGIEVAGAGTFNVSNNTVGNATASNIRTGYLLSGVNLSNTATTPTAASGGGVVRGIASSATGATLDISNNIIRGILVSGTASSYTGISTTGNVATMNINSNQLGNAVTNAVTFPFVTSNTVFGISIFTINPGTANINNNSIYGITCAGANSVRGIITSNGASLTTININNNAITNNVINGTAVSSTMYGITNSSVASVLNITGNIIRSNSSTATSGGFTGIENTGAVINAVNITSNQLGNASGGAVAFSAATTGTITAIHNGAAGSTAVVNITNNSIDGISAVTCNNTIIIYQQGDAATININNNALGTTTGVLLTYSNAGSGSIDGILNSGGVLTTTLNINNNSIDGVFVVNCGSFLPIRNLAPNVGVAINMEYNALGTATGTLITTTGAQSADIYGLFNNGGTSTTAISIQYNDITGIVHSVLASCDHEYILNNKAGVSNTVSNNTFTNLSVHTTGQVTMIGKSGDMIPGATTTISNNSIVTAFNKTGNGGTVYMYNSSAASASGSTVTVTGNSFSNVTVTGSCNISVFDHIDGVSVASAPSCNFSGNILNNIVYQTGQFTGFSIQRGLGVNISTNTITNVSGGGDCTAIYYSSSIGTGTLNINANNISTLSSAAGSTRGIYGSSTNVTTANIYNNTLTGFSAGGFNGLTGIIAASGTALNIYDNQISNLSTSSSGLPVLNGIALGTHTTVNIYNNQIYNLLSTGAVSSTAPAVKGISFTGAATATVYNNFVADLKATAANLTDAIRGISVTSTTAGSTFNLYYNSIYINAASTGTNFGSSGIYHTTDVTATTAALNMINNIIVNTSVPRGTGRTVAYRRSDATLTNYAATSDYNLLYSGTPSATNLIFFDGTNSDQTLAAYQTRVSTRDANSISVMPNFVSSTNLHLQFSLNCQIEGRGTPVPGITTDIDAQTRNATTPDIGADEFTGGLPLEPEPAFVSTCENRNVSATGTTYISPYCSLIARVVPSGADPVSGRISACVTLDATQQYFNGEPYVQRHFDIEPATGNQTSTSATITLYFTDSEFELYNTNNPAWPKLPTDAGGGSGDPNRANLKITQFHGAATTSPSSPGNYPGSRVLIDPVDADINFILLGTGYWAVTFPVTGFSGFYVHTNNFNAPLPITVNYLTGRKQGSNHLLNWKVTCNSTPSVTMTLERSSDSCNFSGINTITADAARCNQPFDHTDANPLKGMNYYRLKMVDAAGKVTYSTTVALLNAVKGFDIISIAPNPVVNDNFKLNVASAQSIKIELAIFDMQGRLMNRQTLSLIAGFNSLPVNVANLSPGIYTMQGITTGNKSKVIRFVKQ